ncbi:hypothetical protein Tco_0339556 [Tanacetum coccineum]
MAHDSMNQVVREEATVGENVSNKMKWGSDHGWDSDQQQSKRNKVVRAYITGAGNKKATSAPVTIKRALVANQKPAVTCFGCGAQRHFKSKYPRLKNQMYDNQKKKEGKICKKSKVVKELY